MRSILVVFAVGAVLAAASIPALAAKPIAIEQLQRKLVSAQAAHETDDAVSRQLSDIRLTTRLTGAALQELIALSPGLKTTQALQAIAGTSTFLEPPSYQLPATPAPDIAAQKAIIARTINYVAHTLPALPNFFATRVTNQFVDTAAGLSLEGLDSAPGHAGELVQRGGLILIGVNNAPISFRDGRETDDPNLTASLDTTAKKSNAKSAQYLTRSDLNGGLSSWGEFGPILGVILLDAAKGKLAWLRWQQEDGKPVAVFQFSVDRSNSDYSLNYCCESYYSDGPGMPIQKGPSTTWKPGYHGRLEVDPETGTILRVTIEADLRPGDPIQRASMMVEYAPVKIGDLVSFCPTRSISVSVSHTNVTLNSMLRPIDRLQLNEVEFVGYRRFGSETTLLAGPATSDGERDQSTATPIEAAANANSSGPTTPPASTTNKEADSTPAPQPSAKAIPAESAADQEILLSPADVLPGLSGNNAKPGSNLSASSENAGFTLKTTTRTVDVDLVASDKRGKPIGDLKENEVAVFDNGRQQQVRDFFHATLVSSPPSSPPSNPVTTPAATPVTNPTPTQATPAALVSKTETAPPVQDTFTNTAPDTAHRQDAPDLLILLLDESHLAFLDLNRAREEVLRFLATARRTSRIALYSISEQGFLVIQDVTQDHALVISRLKAWTPNIRAVTQGQAPRPGPHATVETMSDPQSISDAEGNSTSIPVAVQTRNLPLRYALESMFTLARHFGSVPGRRSIAWISGDMALGGWMGMKGAKELDETIQHAKEALNEAHIALYAVDASSPNLGSGGFDATVENPNGDLPPIQNGPMGPRPLPASAPTQQLALAIQGPARDLAEATGGRAINKGSDLKATLDAIDRESGSYYELAFDPDTPADGRFHALLVKAPTRKDVVLRYRASYLYSEESASTQQRFQQAVWSPQDASAISLTAEVEPSEASANADAAPDKSTINLRIGFPGLALVQKDNHWTDQLYIFVAVRDDATQKAEVSGDTLRLSLRQASYDSGIPAGIPYQSSVETKSRLGSVRIIVVDGNSGKMGSVTLPSAALYPQNPTQP
jgi:VWFA-related protein